jgi:ankyrin repeat protein
MFVNVFKTKNAKITPSVPLRKDETHVARTGFGEASSSTMRVVRLHTVFKLYGGQRHPRIESYEVLKSRGELEEYRYIPPDSTTIYISHEWVGTNHPDPDGTQMYHLLLLLERLQSGEIAHTDMHPFHTVIYKHNHTTTAREWKRILNSKKTFIWYDGFCVPRSRREDGFQSIPSYIRRCDFMIILAPGCTHFDRIDPRTKRKMNLCYRTYRLRARCVFELFCAFLTTRGEKRARPALLVRSGTGTPNWISPSEAQKLSVGASSFWCCESNHAQVETCLRVLVKKVMRYIIRIKIESLFCEAETVTDARISAVFEQWWLRNLHRDDSEKQRCTSVSSFKRDCLQWRQDEGWFDRDRWPILVYAAVYNQETVIIELLEQLESIRDTRLKRQYLKSCVPKEGLSTFGVIGGMTALMAAAAFAKPSIVSLLLEHGANPLETDVVGNDTFMYASILGRIDNVKFWLERFSDWNLERKNKTAGGVALSHAVFNGPHRLELVKLLLDHGASTNYRTYIGSSVLITICASEDADPEVLQTLLKNKSKLIVNYKLLGGTIKWRIIYRLARFLARFKLTNSGFIKTVALKTGITALHESVLRGDMDAVELLLRHGADPTIKNDIGKTPVDYCDAFPELRGALKRVIHMQERSTKHTIVTLHRRNTTATDMKFPMYLVPLDQLHRLYGGQDPRHERIEAHQELKQRGELVRWEDLSIDAHIIFFSHEWVGWSHPDPHGIQLKTFLKVMKRLQSGEISQVEMNVFHTMMFKTNYVVKAQEWKDSLSTSYVWIDWASMPQPSACPPSASQEKKKEMGTELAKAVKSIPAYVIFTLSHSAQLN